MTNKSANDMKNPKPLNPEPSRKICPVCEEPSYSREGVHPQCSAAQADANLVRETKKARKDAEGDDALPATDDLEDI
jgi:hypothetical protein